MIHTLTDEEWNDAYEYAQTMHEDSARGGYKNAHGLQTSGKEEDFDTTLHGLLAEKVWSVKTGMHWPKRLGAHKKNTVVLPDFDPDIEIKSSFREKGDMILRPWSENFKFRFVFIVPATQSKRTWRVVGWFNGPDIEKNPLHYEQFYDGHGQEGRPVPYSIPQSELRHMETFILPNGEHAMAPPKPKPEEEGRIFYKVMSVKTRTSTGPSSLPPVYKVDGLGLEYPIGEVVVPKVGPIFAFLTDRHARRNYFNELETETRSRADIFRVEGEIDHRYDHVGACVNIEYLTLNAAKQWWMRMLALGELSEEQRKDWYHTYKDQFVKIMRRKHPKNPVNWSPSPWMRLEPGLVFLKWVKVLNKINT